MTLSFYRFLLKNGFKNIIRNMTLSVFTIITISLTLTLLGIMMVVVDGANQIMSGLLNSQQLEIYFNDNATESRILYIVSEMKEDERVNEVVYIDKAAALQRFRNMLGEDSALLDGYSPDKHPFPASCQVTMKNVEDVEPMVEYATALDGVKSVTYSQQFTQWMMNTGGKLYIAGMVVIFIVGLIALLLIGSSVRVSIYSRRSELQMMRLIGATKPYIQGPFVAEGAILAILGTITACLTVGALSKAVLGGLDGTTTFMNIGYYYKYNGPQLMKMIWSICSVAGISIGVLASIVSTRKYIKI